MGAGFNVPLRAPAVAVADRDRAGVGRRFDGKQFHALRFRLAAARR